MDGKPQLLNTQSVYSHDSLRVDLASVRNPDGEPSLLHIVEPKQREHVAAVVHDAEKGFLLLWRYNFANDEWSWEIPQGAVTKSTEPLANAAKRIVLDQTGWKATEAKSMFSTHSAKDYARITHVYLVESPSWEGPGRDTNNAGDMSWIPVANVGEVLKKHELTDCVTQAALFYFLTST